MEAVEGRMSRHSDERMSPVDAAQAFIELQFPESIVAIVAGSFMRGEDTPTSDLDLMIVTHREGAPFRASFRAFGWPIEAFVHTPESYRRYFQSDVDRRIPALPTVCIEGIVLRDADGLADRIRAEARDLIADGPPPLTEAEREDVRYALTDSLDDLLGTMDAGEEKFIAHEVAEISAKLLLLVNNRWIGRGKWLVRALRRFDEQAALRLDAVLSAYYRDQDKSALIAFARETLEAAGGPVFEGYYRSGRTQDS
jgi:hypothetical protein